MPVRTYTINAASVQVGSATYVATITPAVVTGTSSVAPLTPDDDHCSVATLLDAIPSRAFSVQSTLSAANRKGAHWAWDRGSIIQNIACAALRGHQRYRSSELGPEACSVVWTRAPTTVGISYR